MDKNSTLLGIGIGGSIITALCCFTPVLVMLLGAVGAAAWAGYLDVVLFPTLLIFVGLTAYALRKRRQTQMCSTSPHEGEKL